MTNAEALSVLAGADADERDQRLADGAADLAAGSNNGTVASQRQFLLAVAGALMTLGLTVIVLGWIGAARTTHVEEQIPYLISGGLFGLGLTTVGALTFFSHWFVSGIREARTHEAARRQDHAELLTAITTLTDAIVQQEGTRNGSTGSARPKRPVRRATSR